MPTPRARTHPAGPMAAPRLARAARLLVCALALAIAGCGGGPSAVAPAATPSPSARTTTAPSSLVAAWEAAAVAEGTIRVYAELSPREVHDLAQLAARRYPNVRIDWTRGPERDLRPRALAELAAGGGAWDVYLGDGAPILAASGAAAGWSPPEEPAIRRELADPRGRWFSVAVTHHVLQYNIEEVPFGERPTAYETLRQPRYVGRLAVEEDGVTWLKGLIEARGRQPTLDLLAPLAAQGVVVRRDPIQLSAMLGAGRSGVAIANRLHVVEQDRRTGAKVAWVGIEPVVTQPTAVVVAADAPSPNGARLIANLLLSADAQHALAQHGRVPARFDVSPEPQGLVSGLRTHLTAPPVGEDEQALRALYTDLWNGR
jgi:iron(III) transport system substrate-binding protein